MRAVLQQLSFEVILPIIVGQLIRLAVRPHQFHYLRPIPSLLLLYIILCVFSATFITGIDPTLFQAVLWTMAIAIVLHALILLMSWWCSGWRVWKLTKSDRIAALFCSTQKTLALGVPLVSILYADHPNLALLTLPLIIYHPLQLFIGGILVSRLKST
jgi:sodium/bile acid cotransporter 7